MARITYTDKVNVRVIDLPNVNKVRAEDLNEIKDSVNALYDASELVEPTENYTLPVDAVAGDMIYVYNNGVNEINVIGNVSGSAGFILYPEETLSLKFNGVIWRII